MEQITGQVIYCGPMIPQLGLQYGAIFRNGIHAHLYVAIAECPALGSLFVSVKEYAGVRRQLDFDIARNMRGTSGKHVTFYQEVQNWLARKNAGGKQATAPTIGVTHHAK
jgi:hypothetical protein